MLNGSLSQLIRRPRLATVYTAADCVRRVLAPGVGPSFDDLTGLSFPLGVKNLSSALAHIVGTVG